MDKVYIVFQNEVADLSCLTEVVSVHSTKKSADKAALKLNKANTNPMEEDCYGPLRGTEYEVREYGLKV